MEIVGGKIQLFVTEEEADIILKSLARYEGPYGNTYEDNHRNTMIAEELERVRDKVEKAKAMCGILEGELMRLYYEKQERIYPIRGDIML